MMDVTTIDSCVKLRDGNLMPLLGFGTSEREVRNPSQQGNEGPREGSGEPINPKDQCGAPFDKTANSVEIALDSGYRHIDAAYVYENEESVGKGIHNWLKKSLEHKREDIFIVSKLPCIGMTKDGVKKFLKLSLKKLELSYLDLYLVHAPIGIKYHDDDTCYPRTEDGSVDVDDGTDLIAVWKEMEHMVEEGLAKSIGLSNFNIRQMKKILAVATIPPVVNQVEMHINFQQKELVTFCLKSKIVVTAFAPLGSPGRDFIKLAHKNKKNRPPPPLENPVVKLVADNHIVTPAQILIKFLIQQGIVTIPKSVNSERIKSNGKVFHFTLTETEMEALKLMDKGEDGRLFLMFTNLGLDMHPECPFP